MNYFENTSIEEQERRDAAFQTIIAVREAVSLARKQPQPITYEDSLELVSDLRPDDYQLISKLLSNKNESPTVKYYKELAEIHTESGDKKEPLELIEEDLVKLQTLSNKRRGKKNVEKKIYDLLGAKEHFQPRKVSEHKVLANDFYHASHGYFNDVLYKNDSYKDYKLPNNHYLRLRLLHPDNEEAILGVDMIYEVFNLEKEEVRFAHLQYKSWDMETLYINEPRMNTQIDKVETNLCKTGLCADHNGERHSSSYRLPYCSGFLRPTSKLISSESKLISTGVHIPICEYKKIKATGNKLTHKIISNISISSRNFEDLFNDNILGSRWVQMGFLEDFYEKRGIKNLTDIRVHAQEIIPKKTPGGDN